MAPAAAATPNYKSATDAKELFDLIGGTIQKQAEEKAKVASKKYFNELHGDLSKATYPKDERSTGSTENDPCKLDYRYNTNVTKGGDKEYPCLNRSPDRFSDKQGAECATSKIKDSTNSSEGACAPFRRLNLCDQHLSHMEAKKIDNTHKLLLEVCLAAKFEGQSISGEYTKYRAHYSDLKTNICTELARSFADIGDIIRGKDLYIGNKKERARLEDNLKNIFKEIHKKLKGREAQTDYNDTEGNFFKLREDWWALNREKVWKAITCSAPEKAHYRIKNLDGETTQSNYNRCQCISGNVLTNFDYVPQYLRWFEEWAEDFCIKRKHKLENAIKTCRGPNGNDKYCDRNGYDCTKTISAEQKLFKGDGCIKCSVACDPFVPWINKQKQEFEKQKQKYDKEIKKKDQTTTTSIKIGDKTINNLYVGEFYSKLNQTYGSVDEFLKKLNEEGICKDPPQVGTEKADAVDFTKDKTEKTFYRTEYCEPCPWCGVQSPNPPWKAKDDTICAKKEKKKTYPDSNTTTIPVLTPDSRNKTILKKLQKFCENPDKENQIKNWECHYEDNDNRDVNDDSDNCILGKWENFEKGQEFKSYYSFFYDSIIDMLNDSIDWRTELNRCLDKANPGKCVKKCNSKCKCYKRWIEEKKRELQKIKEHFGKQKNIHDGTHDAIFIYTLKDGFLQDIEEAYPNKQQVEKIKNLLGEKIKEDYDSSNGKTIIEEFLEEEGKKAETCLQKHQNDDCPPQESLARSESADDTTTIGDTAQDAESEDEEQYDEEEEEDKSPSGDEEESNNTSQDTENSSKAPVDNGDPPCKIVETLFEKVENLTAACQQKYQYGKERFPNWKCVTPTTTKDNKGEVGSVGDGQVDAALSRKRRGVDPKSNDSNQGAICVPPRRRRLYVGPLIKLGDTDSAPPGVPPPLGGETTQGLQASDLRDAFVKSAAVETFFLWHRYKKEWEQRKKGEAQDELLGGTPQPFSGPHSFKAGAESSPEQGLTSNRLIFGESGLAGQPPGGEPSQPSLVPFGSPPGPKPALNGERGELDDQIGTVGSRGALTPLGTSDSDDPNDPDAQLRDGKIPNDFLRQMFYTIADYRDILVGNTPEGIDEVIRASEKDKEGQGSDKDSTTKLTVKQISTKIKEIIEKPNGDTSRSTGGNNPSLSGRNHHSSVKPGTSSGKSPPNSDKRSTLWETTLGPAVWNGMICALTYEDKSEIEQKGVDKKPQKVEAVEKAFFGDENKPKDNTVTTTGTYKDTYHYDNAKLDDTSETGPKITGGETYLSKFVLRPTYFRYLEEWGETFCSERGKRLKEIYKECKVESDRRGNGKKCSGYGEDCETILSKNSYDILPSLECPDCGKHCRWYKKWINTKKDEFDKQKDRYQTESTNYDDSTYDKLFCGTVTTYTDAAEFLQNLGSCKNHSESGGNNIKFGDDDTFKDAKNCKPCPKFKINCEKGNCSKDKGEGCENKTITTENFGNERNSIGNIDMVVSDDSKSGSGFENDLQACKEAHVFKGIKKEWTCRKVCGYVVCTPKNGNREKDSEKKNNEEIIRIRALVTHWVYNFLEDYNKIKHKISHCKENSEQTICKKDCKDKCKCVDEWINKKRIEWTNLKKLYLEQYKGQDYYNVKTILEEFKERPVLNKAIKPCGNLEQFESSCGLNGADRSEKGKKDEDYDLVKCLLKKLEDKAKKCQEHQTSVEPCPQTTSENPDDEDEQLEEETEVNMPNICPKVEEKKKEEDESECKAATTQEETKVVTENTDSTDSGESKDGGGSTPDQDTVKDKGTDPKDTKVNQEEKSVPPAQAEKPSKPKVAKKAKTKRSPKHPKVEPRLFEIPITEPLQKAMISNTLMWSIGISFAALTYWWLKKKTKSSVDMLRVMQIPQNDYGIPTLKSRNRYIPYTSGKYRGKRYIYLEGDSGTDSGYTDHYSDITSSSESEYEEFDINDIYVPGSPKYKTLIEVVLEPSTRDTFNTPSADTPTNKPITDNEWNELKKNFISNMLQNKEQDVSQPDVSKELPLNTHPIMSRHTLDQKPFIMSIHDRDLYTGEEYNYDMSTNSGRNNLYSGKNDLYSGIDPTSSNRGSYSDNHDSLSGNHHPYSGIDLINDTLSGNHDIYNELLKRKENELFGTENTKHTTTNHFAKPTNSDPITNQLELFHKWLDRHRNMCEKLKNDNERLAKLKEKWENDTSTSGNKHSDIPSNIPSSGIQTSDIHSDIQTSGISSSNKTLNTDVSIQIDMDIPKPINQFTNMDTILDDLEKYNEPYYDFYDDDIYYDVNDDKTSVDHINMDYNKMDYNNSDVPTKVQIEMNIVNNKKEIFEEEYPMSDIWNI
ncbi:erythrocyte membrane protein 1, PfEMP1, putative [Plasmodium reichenowi]|uniref:Erythrocyte membrane protein 1, PfEMP1, putative n=1 Tax=Plasmodium reichenowi TaxID=5854 RepID=A0A2P9DBM6_PLARE|nr:erythrocyte membrane protein 1, PfEMP1, putative [Plasmodium reichenowi]